MHYLLHIVSQILLAKLLLFREITVKLFKFNVITSAKYHIYAKKLPPLPLYYLVRFYLSTSSNMIDNSFFEVCCFS